MLGIKKFNNNTVVCRDDNGRELIALGKGIGFDPLPREIPLASIERTFYEVDKSLHPLAQTLPEELLIFSDSILDLARDRLPYEFNPNLIIMLADHISFALERARKKIFLTMPLEYDVRQTCPTEYQIGEFAVSRINRKFNVRLPENEAVGIALCLINGKKEAKPTPQASAQVQDAEMLEHITEIIEDHFGVLFDRKSFEFSRYASHVQLLFKRIHSGKAVESVNVDLWRSTASEFPDIVKCIDKIAACIQKEWGSNISEEEKLYLLLHINRICSQQGL